MQLTRILAAGLAPGVVLGRVLLGRAVICEFEWPANSGDTCESLAGAWAVSVDDFKKLNPGVACPDLVAGQVYCLMGTVTDEPVSTTSTQFPSTSTLTSTTTQSPITTSSPTTTQVATTTRASTTTTLPGNGVTTPVPTQPGMVENCNRFHFVEQDQTCADIATRYSISTAQFTQWNPAAKGDCTGLWASTYACVGIIGATPTQPGNGIETPTPAHPGMVSNCNKFYKVNPGDTCDHVAFWGGAPGTEWVIRWNTGVGPDCGTLQVNTYACVGVVGGTPTQPGNGIETPSPAHPGMVSNCNKFVYVNPGDTCDAISFWNDVGGGQWVKLWNGLSEDCRGLQAHTYVCIGVIGGTPTQPGNGITTPVPTQPGMVSNCDKFVYVNPGDTCDIIAFWNDVGSGQYVTLWNGLSEDCRGLQAHTYACIGVI